MYEHGRGLMRDVNRTLALYQRVYEGGLAFEEWEKR